VLFISDNFIYGDYGEARNGGLNYLSAYLIPQAAFFQLKDGFFPDTTQSFK